jgi:cAMP-specific phosphodiesterase 4
MFFVIAVMCSFGLSMNNSVCSIALKPLERMLLVVRKRCAEIFAYTDNLEGHDSESESEVMDTYAMDQTSEFELLERVVAKLADIVKLATVDETPEMKDDMSEGEIMALNWMQGARVSTGAAGLSPASGVSGLARVPTLPLVVAPDDLIQELASAGFNPLNLSKEMRVAMAGYMVTTYEGCCVWVQAYVHERQLRSFLTQLAAAYQPNPYHNFAHAVDVEHCCRTYMPLAKAGDFLSDVAQFWLLIAAIGHDVGHTGVNNQFLIETQHELAMRYNDRSPLENMHCARLFEIASQPQSNIFSQMQKCVFKEMRKSMIAAILHTDISKHDEIVKGLHLLYQINSEAFNSEQPGPAISPSNTNIQLVLNSMLHTADVSNAMKPWELCHRLAHLCMDEFFAQGDLEKASGLPVQMLNDRDRVSRSHSQVGFAEFLVLPLVTAMVCLFPRLDFLALHLGQNVQCWSDLWRSEARPGPEELMRVQLRVQRVVDECAKSVRGGGRSQRRPSTITVVDGTNRRTSKRGTI